MEHFREVSLRLETLRQSILVMDRHQLAPNPRLSQVGNGANGAAGGMAGGGSQDPTPEDDPNKALMADRDDTQTPMVTPQ